jgi:signal transduction histidine kinase
MASQTEIRYVFEEAMVDEPPVPIRLQLYRIAQVALANARKHAAATRVDVRLESRDRGYLVRVRDDGRGFDVGEGSEPGHLGISSMRERAEMLGGWLSIETDPGSGTTVEFWLPAEP